MLYYHVRTSPCGRAQSLTADFETIHPNGKNGFQDEATSAAPVKFALALGRESVRTGTAQATPWARPCTEPAACDVTAPSVLLPRIFVAGHFVQPRRLVHATHREGRTRKGTSRGWSDFRGGVGTCSAAAG